MGLLSASELAATLNVSKARVSQYVSEGKLDGCYSGDGRLRRFDLSLVADRLGRKLDLGQMMGNGAATRKALATLDLGAPPKAAAQPDRVSPPKDGVLDGRDPDRYELARTQKAEEETRRLRRLNAEAEGSYTLATEVTREVSRQMGQEISEFESVLRDGARQVADVLGVDFKVVRQILVDRWRAHRTARAAQLSDSADAMGMSDTERAADI